MWSLWINITVQFRPAYSAEVQLSIIKLWTIPTIFPSFQIFCDHPHLSPHKPSPHPHLPPTPYPLPIAKYSVNPNNPKNTDVLKKTDG